MCCKLIDHKITVKYREEGKIGIVRVLVLVKFDVILSTFH